MSEPMYQLQLAGYLEDLVPPRDPVMQEMEADAQETRFPIIGAAAVVVMFLVALRYQRFGTAFLPFMRSIGYSVIDITSAAVLSFICLSPTTKPAGGVRWRPPG